jgi:hypothetical protein
MATPQPPRVNTGLPPQPVAASFARDRREHDSAVSWAAIFAGAVAMTVLFLLLLMLGTGLGLSSVSPWSSKGISATTFGVSAVIWLIITQLIASGMGGYLAGRLRTKWVGLHTDETYFRDTVHGFLAWAVAALAATILLSSAIASIVSGGAEVGARVAGGIAETAAAGAAGAATVASNQGSGENNALSYFTDKLFRPSTGKPESGADAPVTGNTNEKPDMHAAEQAAGASTAQVVRIFLNNIGTGKPLPPEDARYAGELVAQRTGLSQQEAEKRVSDGYAQLQSQLEDAKKAAQTAVDEARKASARVTLWLFIALLIGAFVASFSAIYGGRHRDL